MLSKRRSQGLKEILKWLLVLGSWLQYFQKITQIKMKNLHIYHIKTNRLSPTSTLKINKL